VFYHPAKVRFLYFATMNSIYARDYFIDFAKKLTKVYDEDEARALAGYVCAELLLIKWQQLNIIQKQLSTAEVEQLERILNRLLTGEPIHYILGYNWFYGLKFEVNPSVLIPRPETEELVDLVIAYCRKHNITSPTVIDLGTGSGCIPISIKKNIPAAKVYGVDVIANAIATANQNTLLHKTDVTFIEADMLNVDLLLNKIDITQQPIILISNPPYIAQKEAESIHVNVLKHEPHTALFVSNDDALLFYKAIANFADKALKQGDSVWLEINPLFATETLALFNPKTKVYQSSLINDLSGKQRFVNVLV
jgi:release factor glutamine methyltransferase